MILIQTVNKYLGQLAELFFLKLVILVSFSDIILEILLCFSLVRNTKRIMDAKVPAGAITSLNGMRVLSMWWVILGHTTLFLVFGGNLGKYGKSVYYKYSHQSIIIIITTTTIYLALLVVHLEEKNCQI